MTAPITTQFQINFWKWWLIRKRQLFLVLAELLWPMVLIAALVLVHPLGRKFFLFLKLFDEKWDFFIIKNCENQLFESLPYPRHYTTHLELTAHIVKSPFFVQFLPS